MSDASIGVVVIGRNEGERLRACLMSLRDVEGRVYVDSGSSDGSCALARSLQFDVVELEVPPGFTAARARNAGIARLAEGHPNLIYVQTVDGDCEIRTGWLDRARHDLDVDGRRAVVFGRRRERDPDCNAFHKVCDDEWDIAPGVVASCGGDALFRLSALAEVGGFNDTLIAGEEPDLCLRLRERGWTIWSNGSEMTWHDIAMSRLGQWWRRSARAGFAFAELVRRHGKKADPHWRRLLQSAFGWSAIMVTALLAVALAIVTRSAWALGTGLLLSSLLALQSARLALKQHRRKGWASRDATAWAALIMIAKLAQTSGLLLFLFRRAANQSTSIIEYKGAESLQDHSARRA